MQRNVHIDTKKKMDLLNLQRRMEAALEELERAVNVKVSNFLTVKPTDTRIRLNETTNSLYVYNTTTKEWVEYTPA